jgi:thymidylate synthase
VQLPVLAQYSVSLACVGLQVCGLKAGEFVHFLGDAHVYSNHVGALEEQLQNAPRAFPTLHINQAVTDIDNFKFEDFEIRGYHPHQKIPMKMAV